MSPELLDQRVERVAWFAKVCMVCKEYRERKKYTITYIMSIILY